MHRRRCLVPWFGLAALALAGCADLMTHETETFPAAQALLGKRAEALRACAGPPIATMVRGEQTVWVYFKEASQLEESFAGSKSSVPMVHHGCRARILIEQDRVTGVQYDSEPASYNDDEHCEQIFRACLGPQP